MSHSEQCQKRVLVSSCCVQYGLFLLLCVFIVHSFCKMTVLMTDVEVDRLFKTFSDMRSVCEITLSLLPTDNFQPSSHLFFTHSVVVNYWKFGLLSFIGQGFAAWLRVFHSPPSVIIRLSVSFSSGCPFFCAITSATSFCYRFLPCDMKGNFLL